MLPALFSVDLKQLVARFSVAQLLEMQWLGFVVNIQLHGAFRV